MIENSPRSKAETVEKLLLEGNVDAAEEQFRSDYLDAIKNNRIDAIEAEKRELMKDPTAYKLLMLEISKDFLAKNSSSETRLENVILRGQSRYASADDRLRGDAAQTIVDNYSELTGGARHALKKTFTFHWGHGVVKSDVERVEKELKQKLGVRTTSAKLSGNCDELFQKISADGRNITPTDVANTLRKDDQLGHRYLTSEQRQTVERLYKSADRNSDGRRTNFYDMPKAWSNISITDVRQHVRPEDYRYLRLLECNPYAPKLAGAPLRSDNSLFPPSLQEQIKPSGNEQNCEPEINAERKIRPRENANACPPENKVETPASQREKAPACEGADSQNADGKRLEDLEKLAVVRKLEGYSYVATRLLGFAKPEANKAEIERAFRCLSGEDRKKVMALSGALERANGCVRTGLLHPGDALPIRGQEVQALLKK